MTSEKTIQALESALEHEDAGRSAEAERIYRQVLAENSDEPDALYLLGLLLGHQGKLDEAIRLVGRAISVDSDMAEYHGTLGELFGLQRKTDASIASFKRAVALDPDFAMAWFNLGLMFRAIGDYEAATEPFQKAVQLLPEFAEAHTNLGLVLKQQGELDYAIGAYRSAIAIKPNGHEAHNNLGNALAALGRLDESVASLSQAIRLKPDFPEAYGNLGGVLSKLHRRDESIAAYSRAVQLRADDFDSWFCLGNELQDAGRADEAIAAYRTAIALRPERAGAYANLSNALRQKGQLDEAAAAAEKSLVINPRLVESLNNLANHYKEQGRLGDAITCLRKALEIDPGFGIARSNLAYSVYFHPDYDAAMIRDENLAWAQHHEKPLAEFILAHQNDRSPDRRLKIGYVSAELYCHPMAELITPILAHHDAENFQVYCYTSIRRPDEMTARLKKLAHVWRDVLLVNDADLARQIREDQIDILIDLTMHMSGCRLMAFARKPAPVQVTWLGYPGTTGLRNIDYRLTDPHMDPPGNGDEFYSERSIRLPNSFWCYQPMFETAGVNPLPALLTGHVTFGCLNQSTKVTPESIKLWSEVLNVVAGSRMIILSMPGEHRRRIRELFAMHGIDAGRLDLVDRMMQKDYFQMYHRIDLCLDPIPYPGHTSSLDALWMGVPSVTLAGRTAASRGGASILTNIGLPEFIAHSPEQYVSIAASKSADLQSLASLRAGLRDRMQRSPLMNAKQFTADLEAAYRKMWKTWAINSGERV